MAWCFSTGASVATVVITHPCISSCLWVNSLRPSDAYICVSNLTIIGSVNGLLPGKHQAIIWTIAGILLTGPLGSNFSIFIQEIYLKMLTAKWQPFCVGLIMLTGDEKCHNTLCHSPLPPPHPHPPTPHPPPPPTHLHPHPPTHPHPHPPRWWYRQFMRQLFHLSFHTMFFSSSYQYRKSHSGYEMLIRLSYLHNGIPHTDKTAFHIESRPWLGLTGVFFSNFYHL